MVDQTRHRGDDMPGLLDEVREDAVEGEPQAKAH
jgi:hypothetical protein